MFVLLSKVVSTSVGFLFPVYSSYKAIRANEQDAIESWLMYWVVMAGLHAVENTIEWTVNWFPFYYEAKSIIILWLTLPQIQGSTYVYLTYINPFLLEHEREIDQTIAQTKESAKAAGLDYMRRAYVYAREAITRALLSAEGATRTEAAAAHPDYEPDGQHAPSQAAPPQGPSSPQPAQQAWAFANNMLRSYGPAAVAAGSSLFRPLRNVNTSALHAENVPLDEVSRRKKYDDLGIAGPARSGPRDRLYSQEVSKDASRRDRRIQSASAALVGATGGAASSSAYSSYTRAQLRQRRLELEQELAALDTTSIAPSEVNAGPPSPGPSARSDHSAAASTVRDRHISAPSMPSFNTQRRSPTGTPPNLEASTPPFEKIGKDEVAAQGLLPNDWGRNADKRGWRGAPPGEGASSNINSSPATSERPPHQKRSSWSLWGGSTTSAVPRDRAGPAPSDKLKKNA